MIPQFTRRQLLGALGASGAAAVAGRAVLAGSRAPPYQHYTYAQSDGGAFRVAWYEEYNGRLQETTGGGTANRSDTFATDEPPLYVNDPGPVVTVGNVMPGDHGRVVFGLLAEDVPLDVWIRLRVRVNDVTLEPEADSPVSGQLDDVTDVALWLDEDCNGSQDIGDDYLTGGTFAGVADALGGGVPLAFSGVEGCEGALPVGDPRCVAFEWSLPNAAGNAGMGDSVAFDVEFAGVDCTADVGNPFADGGSR